MIERRGQSRQNKRWWRCPSLFCRSSLLVAPAVSRRNELHTVRRESRIVQPRPGGEARGRSWRQISERLLLGLLVAWFARVKSLLKRREQKNQPVRAAFEDGRADFRVEQWRVAWRSLHRSAARPSIRNVGFRRSEAAGITASSTPSRGRPTQLWRSDVLSGSAWIQRACPRGAHPTADQTTPHRDDLVTHTHTHEHTGYEDS